MTDDTTTAEPSSAGPDVATGSKSALAVIAVLGYCGATVSVMHTVALPLLPQLPDALDATVGDVSWVATATLLAGAVANPALGRMGDMYGKRRVLLLSLGLLFGGSVLCAVADSLAVLVVGRTLQGFGVGVIPIGISIARDELPPDKVSGGIALVSATLGIGGGIGLPLAGALVDNFHWHAVFWVSSAIALVGLVAAALLIPESSVRSPGRFDVLGAAWLSAVLVAFLLPISKSPTWGWTAPVPLALFAACAVGGAGWGRYVLRRPQPVVDLTVMRRGPVLLTNVAGLLLGFAMFNNFFGTITLLQLPDTVEHGFGIDVMVAGLVMAPGALAMVAMSPVSARITDTYGPRTTLIIGAAVVGIAFSFRPFLMGTLPQIAFGVAAVNAGVGITYGALPSVIMAHVPVTETASANAINALARAGGSAISSAAVAAIIGAFTITAGGEIVPSRGAFTLMFTMSAVFALAAAVLAQRLPRRSPVATSA